MSDLTYVEAFELLVKQSRWTRAEVERDPTSAAWFIAGSRKFTAVECEEAQRAGVIVSKGRPE